MMTIHDMIRRLGDTTIHPNGSAGFCVSQGDRIWCNLTIRSALRNLYDDTFMRSPTSDVPGFVMDQKPDPGATKWPTDAEFASALKASAKALGDEGRVSEPPQRPETTTPD